MVFDYEIKLNCYQIYRFSAIPSFNGNDDHLGSRGSPLRSSYHGKSSAKQTLDVPQFHSIDKGRGMDVVGSAESLVGRVLYAEGLGKFIDPGFVKATQRELAEAFNMSQDEMDR